MTMMITGILEDSDLESWSPTYKTEYGPTEAQKERARKAFTEEGRRKAAERIERIKRKYEL